MTGPFLRLTRKSAAAGAGGMLVLALAGSLAYWPGLMTWDSARQYDQAVSGAFDDWHPPAMEWIWRLLLPIADGPSLMLILQLALYFAGFGLVIEWALRGRRNVRALALAACALLPLSVALMGEVIKDSLMAAALMLAVGLWAGASEAAGRRGRWRRLTAAALILAAASLRFNAFLAGFPLLVAMASLYWRGGPVRWTLASLAAIALLLAVMPLANAALHARRSGVEYSLTIFDLAGIGVHSGKDVFPPLGIADPVAVNRQCYTPKRWDSYAEWSSEPCAIHFDLVRPAFERRGLSHRQWWLRAILAHPLAYAEHRLAHWNINATFLLHEEPGRAVPIHSEPDPGAFPVPHTAAVTWVDRLARHSAATPLGWPACWMALALGLVLASPALPSRRLILPLALSGLLYGLGYAVFSVASDERYYLWTMIATALAAALATTDGVIWRQVGRRRLIACFTPLVIVVGLSVLWRVM